MKTPLTHGRVFGLATGASVVGLIGLIVLLVISLAHEYRDAADRARIDAENLSRVLEEHIFATVQSIDLVIRDVEGHLDPEDMMGEAGPARAERLHALLTSRLATVPQATGLNVVDRRGNFIYSAYDPVPRVNIADRYHFKRHAEDPRAGLVISPPLLARTTGKWSVVLTRRVSFADGRFAGVVNAVLDLEYFQALYRSLQLGPHGTVVLRDMELRLLARYPSSEPHMGQLIPGHHAAPYVGHGLKHGVYRAKGQVDGIERLYSFRQVGDLPLVVFAGLAEEDYLAEWRQHVTSYGIAAGVFSLVVIGLILLSRLGMAQREEAEEALKQSEARLNEAQHMTHIGSWELDLVHNKLIWSDEIFHMFEIDREKFGASYEAFLNAIHPDDREQVNRAYTESVANRTPYDILHRLRFADGRIKFVREHCKTDYDEAGKPIRSLGTAQDITESKLAEDRLRESEERFRTLADYTYDWEYWEGPQGEMWYVTPSCERITGYRQEEFLADPDMVYAIIHPDDRALMEAHRNDVAHKDSGTLDFRILRRDGEMRWIAHGCRAVYWSDGRFMGRRASNRDITDRKRLEEELLELNESLERRVEQEVAQNREKDHILIQQSRLAAMGEMVHNIAHQWRQPLNALSILITNIKDDFDFGELNGESLGKAVSQSRRILEKMSSTIDDFRDFFRPDREPGEFNIAAAVEDALFVMDASLKNNNILVEKDFQPDLQAYGYANQFAQAVLNVIANAKEAIVARQAAGGEISIRLRALDGEAELTIRDNGGGIPEDALPRIFDPYFTTKEKGSGIGLYMTKMIIERNINGRIVAANGENGAIVTITLPLLHEEGKTL